MPTGLSIQHRSERSRKPGRWRIYAAIGLCFGILDWYFLEALAALSQNQAVSDALMEIPQAVQALAIFVIVSLNYGIWLVPVIPIAIYETRLSGSVRLAAASAAITWTMAIFSYYAFYAFLLLFVGLPNLDFMLFVNHAGPTYWADWWPPFRRIILDQFLEWIWIAVIGGAAVGAASAFTCKRFTPARHAAKLVTSPIMNNHPGDNL